MKLATQLAAIKVGSGVTPSERARDCCRVAKELEKAGEYEAAREALGEFWPEFAGQPIVERLDRGTTAEVLLGAGTLVGWLSSTNNSERQESAKDLITRSIEIFTELDEPDRVAEAESELAVCYWREGGFDEARATLSQALGRVSNENGDLKALILTRSGVVERTAGCLNDAMRLLERSAPIVEQSFDYALRGTLHNTRAAVLEQLASVRNNADYLDKALIEYAAASINFEKAGHTRHLARVENNLGLLFTTIGKFPEAHEHISRARDIFLSLGDRGHIAQVDDTRARAFLAEGNVRLAERYARAAVRTLSRGDECSLLVEALTTHGVALARLGRYSGARSELQRAINVAETCGDLEGAGRAKLSIIEELSGQTSAIEMASIHKSATDLLQRSQDPAAAKRLISSGRIVIDSLLAAKTESAGLKAEGWEGFSLKRELRAFENSLIERALRDAGGAVTKASRLLGFRHHQSLISLIATRHKDLLKTRSAIRKRRRHLFSAPKKTKENVAKVRARPATSRVSILHVENNKAVARLIQDALGAEGMHVDSCFSGTTGLEVLKSDAPYDAIIVDNDLPGFSGLELILRVRSMAHRRKTPIIMLSGDDIETEAWRAGVKAFLRKPEAVDEVSSTIIRVLKEMKKD